MLKPFSRMKMCLSVILMIGFTFTTASVCTKDTGHKDITLELIQLIEENPEVGELLEQSISAAKDKNSDRKTNPAQSLDEYYDYIDWAVDLIPQDIFDNPTDLIRDQILQSICYFYFLVDQPLDALEGKGLYKNAIQYWEPFATWTRHFADAWGDFLDTEASWTKKTFKQFYKDPQFGLQLGWYESPKKWTTFNQFFSRYLRVPCERPISCPGDPSIVASPADSEPQGVWSIDKDSNIEVKGGLTVKSSTFYNVNHLLAKDTEYKDVFANGVLTHTFLNVFDYHRYHFAVGGLVKEKRIIQQNVALEVKWSEKDKKYIPLDSTGWQFWQTRGYVIVDTGEFGLVALIPMGMAQVSSVNFEDDVQENTKHEKGDMLGNFLFGGSDFIMLFQEQAGFKIMAQKKQDNETYKHIFMGMKYGVMEGASN